MTILSKDEVDNIVKSFADGTDAMWVVCGECNHRWVAVYLPMEARKVVKLMKRLCCPKCAESKTIFMGDAP